MQFGVEGAQLERIARVLEELVTLLRPVLRQPSAEGGQSFHTGPPQANGSPEPAWVGTTNEFRDATREQMEAYFGRPLTEEEERDLDAKFAEPRRAHGGLYNDGFSGGAGQTEAGQTAQGDQSEPDGESQTRE